MHVASTVTAKHVENVRSLRKKACLDPVHPQVNPVFSGRGIICELILSADQARTTADMSIAGCEEPVAKNGVDYAGESHVRGLLKMLENLVIPRVFHVDRGNTIQS
jgi:hypothetical protein